MVLHQDGGIVRYNEHSCASLHLNMHLEDQIHFTILFKIHWSFNYKYHKIFKPHFQCTLHSTILPPWCKTRYRP